MDIQSADFNQLFVLYPVMIPGSVSEVKPAGIADVGIPKALYDGRMQGLECLIDPWTELQLRSWTMAADDHVGLCVNDDPTPVVGKTIAPGEEQQRIRLDLPHGRLNHGRNRLRYKVTRPGGNVETSRDLWVLYHLRLPDSLDLVIPSDVLKEGVNAALAALGVVFGFIYNNRRPFDRIEFGLGDATIRFDAPAAPAPVTQTLFTDAFEKAGDNPSAVAEFYVIDQLGNRSKSPEKRLDIHLGRLNLPAPTVKGQSGNNFSPTQPEIRGLVPQGLLPNDQFRLIWKGATDVPAGSYTSPLRLVSAGLEIAIPRSVLAYSLGKPVTVLYSVLREGQTYLSLILTLNILPLPAAALIPPKIVEADANNFLDITKLGTQNATVHGLLWPLIAAGQQVWLTLVGKKADGTAHNLQVWNGDTSKVNDTWVRQGFWPKALLISFLKELGHESELKLEFKVAMDQRNVLADAVKFPVRIYTVKAAYNTPTFTNPPYVIAPAGRVKNIELLLRNGSTPVSGKITLTIPADFTYADGGSGVREFTTDAKGQLSVNGVKGHTRPGTYTLTANTGLTNAAANMVITAQGGVGTIPVGNRLYGVAVSPDGTRAYICNSQSKTISVIDVRTLTVTTTIHIEHNPCGIAVSPDGTRAYAACPESQVVAVIDLVTQRLIKAIPSGSNSYWIAISPDGNRVYVSSPDEFKVSVIDIVNQRLIKAIPFADALRKIATSPDGTRVYVCNWNENTVSVINTVTLAVLLTIAVGVRPYGVAVSPDSTRVYVSNYTDGTVSVIQNSVVIKTIKVGKTPHGIVVSPNGTRVYVSIWGENKVSVIDAKSLVVIRTIPVGVRPDEIAISPDGTRVYVTNWDSDFFSIIAGG